MVHLLIPAAGVGQRLREAWQRQGQPQRNKLLLPLLGRPILAWTLAAAAAADCVEWIGIVGQPEDWPEFQAMVREGAIAKPVEFIQGGETRQESVYNGLQALPERATRVLIHDGARCLVTPGLFERCAAALAEHEGLIAAIPVKDTIKLVGAQGAIETTPDRAKLWAAQTPQGFAVARLKHCHQVGRDRGLVVTDDAALFEACGEAVFIVEGEETNLKVTTPVDLAIAEFILRQRGDI